MTYKTCLVILDDVFKRQEEYKDKPLYQELAKVYREALEKQIKYRWHDLRKNPEDLPENGETVEVWYEYYHYKAEAVLPEYGHARYYHGVKFWGGDASNESQLKVLAWRYIEPVGGRIMQEEITITKDQVVIYLPTKGEWLKNRVLTRFPLAKNHHCSECGYETCELTNFCPNCGANMRGEGG